MKILDEFSWDIGLEYSLVHGIKNSIRKTVKPSKTIKISRMMNAGMRVSSNKVLDIIILLLLKSLHLSHCSTNPWNKAPSKPPINVIYDHGTPAPNWTNTMPGQEPDICMPTPINIPPTINVSNDFVSKAFLAPCNTFS